MAAEHAKDFHDALDDTAEYVEGMEDAMYERHAQKYGRKYSKPAAALDDSDEESVEGVMDLGGADSDEEDFDDDDDADEDDEEYGDDVADDDEDGDDEDVTGVNLDAWGKKRKDFYVADMSEKDRRKAEHERKKKEARDAAMGKKKQKQKVSPPPPPPPHTHTHTHVCALCRFQPAPRE